MTTCTLTAPLTDRTARIRRLNDLHRTTFMFGKVHMTHGLADMGEDFTADALTAVRTFRDWTEGNDPHEEHDFGAVTVQGERVFWKFDYYDKACEFGSEDPADPKQTTRVLTIMLASEY
jgi:hypothetical protein